MEELLAECAAHGYSVAVAEEEKTESPFVAQLRRLMELSRQVEAATLRLTTLQTQANFEDLVNPMALERKAAMLKEVEGRAAAVLAGKDKILAFVQRNHTRQSALAIESSKQAAVAELFESMSREVDAAEAIVGSVEWGVSIDAAKELERIQTTLTSLTQYQARYQRAMEANESLSAAIDKTAARK